MKFTSALLTFAAISSQHTSTSAFSPLSISRTSCQTHYRPHSTQPSSPTATSTSTPTAIFSSSDDGTSKDEDKEQTPTPKTDALAQQSQSFTNEPKPVRTLDPLLASLTQMDDATANGPTTNIPFIGEVPKDGSLLLLAPVALIAVVGFVMSINIALGSKDLIVQQLDQVNAVLSTPPAKQAKVVDVNSCRGLCSSQDEQLDSMKNFMEGLSKKKSTAFVVVEEELSAPVAAAATIVEERVVPAAADDAVAVLESDATAASKMPSE